jgi:hypothetical protein
MTEGDDSVLTTPSPEVFPVLARPTPACDHRGRRLGIGKVLALTGLSLGIITVLKAFRRTQREAMSRQPSWPHGNSPKRSRSARGVPRSAPKPGLMHGPPNTDPGRSPFTEWNRRQDR